MKTQVCIIGAGPAGLTAAIFAAQAGAKVLLIERGTVAGRKLLKTGRGRCNLTHTGTIDEFVRAYDDCGRFLKPALYTWPPQSVREFFHSHQLTTKEEKDGSVFPITDRATDVCRILVDTARRLNVEFLYGRHVWSVEKTEGGFHITTDKQPVHTAAVIITTGGMSWSYTGSTGDGYRIAAELGHTVVPPKAALCPLITEETWPGTLQGIGIADVTIGAVLDKKKIVARGPLMFTGDGIGGPAVFDLSRYLADALGESGNPIPATVDFLPGMETADVEQWLISECNAHPKKEVAGLMPVKLPRQFCLQLEEFFSPGRPTVAAHFTKDQRAELLRRIKSMPLTIVKTAPLEQATITRGGISRDQIDPQTMQSLVCEGLFFAGEVIDADGPCGGYNLQIAWSTGALAGKAAANQVLNPADPSSAN
jgi:predicted Rossmann fold flavoprotein